MYGQDTRSIKSRSHNTIKTFFFVFLNTYKSFKIITRVITFFFFFFNSLDRQMKKNLFSVYFIHWINDFFFMTFKFILVKKDKLYLPDFFLTILILKKIFKETRPKKVPEFSKRKKKDLKIWTVFICFVLDRLPAALSSTTKIKVTESGRVYRRKDLVGSFQMFFF